LRALLKPGAVFPPNPEQLKAIEQLKQLILDDHVLAVPDEMDAILAANRWLGGQPPAGRPYEMSADTSGYAIGGIMGQCAEPGGKLKVLGYFSAHLSPSQQQWHPFEQEFFGLLCTRRNMIKHFGRIPTLIHTDHANIARVEGLPLERIEAKHYRWNSELRQGGSKILYRPGVGTLHRGPDGISRHPEGRDQLIMARSQEWKGFRDVIKGVDESIEAGEFDDEDPKMVAIETVPPEKLEPLPYAELEAAGIFRDEAAEAIQRNVAKKRARDITAAQANASGPTSGASSGPDGSPKADTVQVTWDGPIKDTFEKETKESGPGTEGSVQRKILYLASWGRRPRP